MTTAPRFPPSVQATLVQAGWSPGRNVVDLADSWIAEVPEYGDHSKAARSILAEFAGLHVGTEGRGIECATGDIRFDPRLLAGEADRIEEYAHTLGALSPLGDAFGGRGFVFADSGGQVLIMMLGEEVFLAGTSVEEALTRILSGLKPHAVWTPAGWAPFV